MDDPRVDKMAFNKNNHNAYQVTLTSEKLSIEEVTSQSICSLSSHQNGTLLVTCLLVFSLENVKVAKFMLSFVFVGPEIEV